MSLSVNLEVTVSQHLRKSRIALYWGHQAVPSPASIQIFFPVNSKQKKVELVAIPGCLLQGGLGFLSIFLSGVLLPGSLGQMLTENRRRDSWFHIRRLFIECNSLPMRIDSNDYTGHQDSNYVIA